MKRKAFVIILSIVLFSSFSNAGEGEEKNTTPREDKHFYLGIGLGETNLFFKSEGLTYIDPSSLFLIRAGWVARADILLGYELFVMMMPHPFSSVEIKHCIYTRYYPLESATGFYTSLGGGILTNNMGQCEGGCASESIDVPYAFFTRLGVGYDFTIGSHTQLGVGLRYYTNFYHATPAHELSLVVEINWYLF